MANSEGSYTKNAANFETLISIIITLGSTYNPAKNSIRLDALQSMLSMLNQWMDAVDSELSIHSLSVNARREAFIAFKPFITRVYNSLLASTSSTLVDESVQSIMRKLRGKRVSPKLTKEEIKALKAEGKEVNQISTSQMDYASQVSNFEKLVNLLEHIQDYQPNEEDLKIHSLRNVLNDLKTKNSEVINTTIQLNKNRTQLKQLTNKPLIGLVDCTVDVKSYIKSVYGTKSAEYKSVSKLRFAKIN